MTRRKDSGKWGVPKGFIDRGHTPEQTALNEAFEEAGLSGRVFGDAIGTYDYKKGGVSLKVAVYAMDVFEEHEDWPEMTFRERSWRSPDDAAALLVSHPIARLWDRVMESVTKLCQ